MNAAVLKYALSALILVVVATAAMVPLSLSKGTAADGAAAAAIAPKGPSGLPLPRFVSLKFDRVNVRRGPSTTHQVAWVFARKGLPVEIIAEFENWRRVRDSEGEEGWIFHSLLTGRRTALVSPWRKNARTEIYAKPDSAKAIAFVESGALGVVLCCNGNWCRFGAGGLEGWIKQDLLWGVYPDEKLK